MGACGVRLLGAFAVTVDGKPVAAEAWRHRRGADLVKLLALAPGHQLHREQVTAALWPEFDAAAAAANLRKALHYARRALGSAGAIEADRDLVRLWPQGELVVDVDIFERSREPELYTGELLPSDRYAEWTEPRREQLKQLSLQLLRDAGRWQEVLDIDRADEEAHRALMRQHLEAGRREAAIRQFYRLREVLRADLGVGPDEETVALYESLIAERRQLPATASERAQALIARGLLAWSQGELDTVEALADEVRALAVEHELGRELGEASALLGMAAFARGSWHERFRREFEEAVRLPAEMAAGVFDAHVCLAQTALDGAAPAAVAELGRHLLPIAEAEGSLHGRALASLLIGEAELASGELESAQSWLLAARDLAEQAASLSVQAGALISLAECMGGRHGQALLARARPLARASRLAPHLTVRVFGAALAVAPGQGDIETTLAIAEAELKPGEFCGPCSIDYRVNAVHACIRAGELSRARHCLAIAEALAGMWQGGPWRAATWEARAALRAAEGDAQAAIGLLREAQELFSESGRRLAAERCAGKAERLAAGNVLGTPVA